MVFLEIALVLALIVANGYLAMCELAVVSARRSRLQQLATSGNPGAATALLLAENPGRFLSTVQIGITLVGVFAGAFSGATLAERFSDYLERQGVATGVSEIVAVAAVVTVISYLSLIIGELVPKQIALNRSERVASAIARPMMLMARWASPAVWLLDASTRVVLGMIGSRAFDQPRVTEEEIRTLIAEAETAGVVEPAEKRMMVGVMRLGDRLARAIMTPRHKVDWLDISDEEAVIRTKLRATPHSRVPAGRGSVDAVAGVVRAKDLLNAWLDGRPMDVSAALQPVPVVGETASAFEVIEVLRKSQVDMVIVVDEYGSFQGLITTANILETIAGEFTGSGARSAPRAVRRGDGSWLIDGMMPCDEVGEVLGTALPRDGSFHTLAGFLLTLFLRVPEVGESVVWHDWRFEVVNMDGRRIEEVMVIRQNALHRVVR
jgi:putative hemolysin